jgi:hypothetical protein
MRFEVICKKLHVNRRIILEIYSWKREGRQVSSYRNKDCRKRKGSLEIVILGCE